jgi:membrane-associated protease RseP (regulator of RpoE activity)
MRHLLLSLFCAAPLLGADVTAPEPTPTPTPAAEAEAAKPRPAWLGIAVDVAATSFDAQGVVVLRIEPGSPAAVMGLAAGDRLLRLDGKPLMAPQDLQRLLAERRPQERISLDVARTQGADQQTQTFTTSGVLQELPRTRTSALGTQLGELQQRLAELEEKSKEPTLAEILERLHAIEQDLPKAAAAFKRIYPDGEFRIAISVEVTSHKTAPDPLAIDVGGQTATATAAGMP